MDASLRDGVYTDAVLERIAAVTDLRRPFLTAEQLGAEPGALSDIEILLTGWGAPALDGPMLARAGRLRAVFHAAGSVKEFVGDEVFDRGIVVVNAASANADIVAGFAEAQIMLSARGFWRAQREYRETRAASASLVARGARDSTVGLVGLGEIGRRVAERLARSRIRVLVHDPLVDEAEILAFGGHPASLEHLFGTAQVVSVHAPLLPSTRGMITGALMASLPEGAVLINTARGAVVDEDALVRVLSERSDLTALLDVTRHEPIRSGSMLWELENVELSPHIAGATGADREALGDAVAAEVERYVSGEELRHRVEPSTLVRSA